MAPLVGSPLFALCSWDDDELAREQSTVDPEQMQPMGHPARSVCACNCNCNCCCCCCCCWPLFGPVICAGGSVCKIETKSEGQHLCGVNVMVNIWRKSPTLGWKCERTRETGKWDECGTDLEGKWLPTANGRPMTIRLPHSLAKGCISDQLDECSLLHLNLHCHEIHCKSRRKLACLKFLPFGWIPKGTPTKDELATNWSATIRSSLLALEGSVVQTSTYCPSQSPRLNINGNSLGPQQEPPVVEQIGGGHYGATIEVIR